MTDKMPTREQIAEAVAESWSNHGYDSGRIADAVLALFPQPTPSAEAIERETMDVQFENMYPDDPEPPSIADMAPGTTFTAEFKETGTRALFVKVGGETAWPILAVDFGALATYTDYAIDPSTIRDVTPPTATPEGGDRG